MTRLRKRLIFLEKSHKAIEGRFSVICDKQRNIEKKISDVKVAIIKKEKLLGNRPWTLEVQDNGRRVFLCADVRDFPQLIKLCAGGFGLQLDLADLSFHEHDGEMTITCDEKKNMLKVLDEYGIVVDLSGLEKKQQELVDSVEVINAIAKRFTKDKRNKVQ